MAILPYARSSELPQAVRDALPSAAQTVFRNVVNAQLNRGLTEEQAFASAWGALKNQGWYKPEDGEVWVKKDDDQYEVLKVDDERRLVFGWANVSVRKDGEQIVDSQGDMIDPEDLENAMYNFVLEYRDAGVNHTGEAIGKLVESFVVTPEKLEKMGLESDALPIGAWIGFKIMDDAVWQQVRKGQFKSFSIGGSAVREPVE